MRQITFAIMCENSSLPAWQAACVRSLLANPQIKLTLIIREVPAKRSFTSRLAQLNLNRLLYLIYVRFFFKPACNSRIDMTDYYKGVEVMNCAVIKKGKFSQYFSEQDVSTIKAHSVDFILRFGFNIIRGEILLAAKYGVWSYHHGDPAKYRGGPPCFWELYQHQFVAGAMLQRLTNSLDQGIVLKQGFFKTCLYSYERTINDIYFESAQWPALLCARILSGFEIEGKEAVKTNAPIYYPPSNIIFLFFLAKLWKNKFAALLKHAWFRDVWNVGVVEGPIEKFLTEGYSPSIEFLPTPASSEFRADPFGYSDESKKFILLEHYDFKKSIGRIERWEYLSQGNFSKLEQWTDTQTHRSYPYVFADGGFLYCMPECSGSNAVSLFKFEEGNWKKESDILTGQPVVDPTLIKHQGKYWIFYTRTDRNSDVNLFIQFAESIHGPWTEHPANPVKSDITSSRPAGNFFWYENELYRPAQNCSRTYGGSIVINKVIRLSESEYEEVSVREISPWHKEFKDGIHTLALFGDKILIDAKRKIAKFF